MKVSILILGILVTVPTTYAMEVAQNQDTQIAPEIKAKMGENLQKVWEWITDRYAKTELASCGLLAIYNDALRELKEGQKQFITTYTDASLPKSVIYRTMREAALSDETYKKLTKIIELIKKFNGQRAFTNFTAAADELSKLIKTHEEALKHNPENEMIRATLPGLLNAYTLLCAERFSLDAILQQSLTAIVAETKRTTLYIQAHCLSKSKIVFPSHFKKVGETYEKIPNVEYADLFVKSNKDLHPGGDEARALISSNLLEAYFSASLDLPALSLLEKQPTEKQKEDYAACTFEK